MSLALPPVGSANTSLQTEQCGATEGLSKTTCSFPHLAHFTRTKLLWGFGINSPLTNCHVLPKFEGAELSGIRHKCCGLVESAEKIAGEPVKWRLGNVELPKPNSKSVSCRITCSAGKPQQLFLGCLRSSFKFGEFLSAVTMLVSFVASVPNRHSPVFPLLVDRYLVISM